MNPDPIPRQRPAAILFTHYGDDWIRGSERCLLDLLRHLDRTRFNPVVWCNCNAMAKAVAGMDIPVIKSEFHLPFGGQASRYSFTSLFRLIKLGIQLVEHHGVALIHANSGAPNQWLNFVARACRIPLLTHLHSRYPLHERISLGLHQVSMAVGASRPTIEQLLCDGMTPEKTCVIPNGIDTERLDNEARVDLRKTLKLAPRDFLIASVGSLIQRKGHDQIVSAVECLVRRGFPIHLAIIGDGPDRIPLQQQINQSELREKAHLLGEQTNVAGLLRGGVDLFVSGAREEAFGHVLAESGLCQWAVVAPKVGGIPSVVVDGKTGSLVQPGSVDALADEIERYYLTPILRQQTGSTARRHILNNFTIQHHVSRFERLYTHMLSDDNSRMRWHTHWQILRPLAAGGKRLFDLGYRKYVQEALS